MTLIHQQQDTRSCKEMFEAGLGSGGATGVMTLSQHDEPVEERRAYDNSQSKRGIERDECGGRADRASNEHLSRRSIAFIRKQSNQRRLKTAKEEGRADGENLKTADPVKHVLAAPAAKVEELKETP